MNQTRLKRKINLALPARNIKIIAIEGIHGVGKTTVLSLLKKRFSYPTYKFYNERRENEPIWPFGSRDIQVAFRSEIYFMQQMIERQYKILDDIWETSLNRPIKACILDRSAISVMVYSKALGLNEKDFKVLDNLFKSVSWHEKYLIYLHATPKTILKRIHIRGSLDPKRLEWNEEDILYIESLEKYYSYYIKYLEDVKKVKIFRVNTEEMSAEETTDAIENIINKLCPRKRTAPGQLSIEKYL